MGYTARRIRTHMVWVRERTLPISLHLKWKWNCKTKVPKNDSPIWTEKVYRACVYYISNIPKYISSREKNYFESSRKCWIAFTFSKRMEKLFVKWNGKSKWEWSNEIQSTKERILNVWKRDAWMVRMMWGWKGSLQSGSECSRMSI